MRAQGRRLSERGNMGVSRLCACNVRIHRAMNAYCELSLLCFPKIYRPQSLRDTTTWYNGTLIVLFAAVGDFGRHT